MAIKSRTLLGGNCASATAAGVSVDGVAVAPANSAAPTSKDLDLIPFPPSCDRAQSVSRMRPAASILLRDSQLHQRILDEIARLYGEYAGAEEEHNDPDQNSDRHHLLQQSDLPVVTKLFGVCLVPVVPDRQPQTAA